MSFKPHLHLAKQIWSQFLLPGDLVIDATVGNGHDAYFLHELGSEVIGLDIQPLALEHTKKLFGEKSIKLYCSSHDQIDSVPLPKAPKLIVYNLGYLPGGDKSITTEVDSTIESVEKSLKLLAPQGALSITCYPGHDEGFKEEIALVSWASKLDPKSYSVCHHRWLNRTRSPSLLWIVSQTPSN